MYYFTARTTLEMNKKWKSVKGGTFDRRLPPNLAVHLLTVEAQSGRVNKIMVIFVRPFKFIILRIYRVFKC